MKIEDLRKKLTGKKLLSIIQLEATEEIIRVVRIITKYDYGDGVDNLQLLVFEDGIELIYTDYDCDGYRSGEWFLSILNKVLDKGATKEIKHINSIVRDIIYLEQNEGDGKNFFLLTTDKYVVTFGQENVSDYYPSNFFNIEECKEKAISDRKIPKGENIEQE